MKHLTFLAASLLLIGASAPVKAEEPTAPSKPWKNTLGVNAVSTNGNSKATTISANEDFVYEITRWKFNLFGSALNSSDRGNATAEQYTAGEKVDFKMTEKDYLYERFKWDSNRFAGYYNRYDGGAGYGRKLLDLVKDKLNVELGAGYVNEERVASPRNDFASGRAYSKYEHLFTEKSKFSQDVEYVHNFDNSKDYRLNTETALIASVTAIVSMKLSFTWNRVAVPPPNTVKDDTKLMAGLLVTY